jgi:hypothetical protein
MSHCSQELLGRYSVPWVALGLVFGGSDNEERIDNHGSGGLPDWHDEPSGPCGKRKDTVGKPFEITLSSGGAAKATRGEGMTGTWKEEGDAAVITWNTGWTTKITKQGNQYHKAAYRKGQSLDAAPANSSDAQKVK